MKSWFFKSKLSEAQEAALISESPALADYPPDLHASIMREVRATERAAVTRSSGAMSWFDAFRRGAHPAFAGAFLAAAVVALWLWQGADTRPTAQQQNPIVQFSPSITARVDDESPLESIASTAPLSGELAGLDRDLRASAEFILASVP